MKGHLYHAEPVKEEWLRFEPGGKVELLSSVFSLLEELLVSRASVTVTFVRAVNPSQTVGQKLARRTRRGQNVGFSHLLRSESGFSVSDFERRGRAIAGRGSRRRTQKSR